jgi:ABC-2 type transport system permease protein
MAADLRLVLVQTRFQLLSTLRNRRAVIFGLVFPVILLVLFNSIFVGEGDSVELAGAKISAQAYFTGAMLAYSIMLLGFSSLALGLVTQRETGQLKRYRGTPVPSWTFIVAVVLRAVAMIALTAMVMLLIARFAYDVRISGEALGELVLYVLLGAAAMCAVGIAATSVVTDVDSASSALPLVAVLLSFISGVFVPVDQLPGWLEEIGRIFPLFHLAEGLQTALGVSGNTSLDAGNVAVLAAWGLAGVVISARRFRWEPQVTKG